MNKVLVLLTMVLGTTNMYAQDYDLQGLAKTLKQLFPNEVDQGEEYYDFHEGLVKVRVFVDDDYKFGYLDKFGKIVIPIIYENAYDFREGLAFVQKNGKWGFIDKNGRTVIPFIYGTTSGNSFHNGIAAVSKDGKSGMIDKSGSIVVPFNWRFLDNYCDGLIFADRINNGKGEHCFINSSGETVIPFGRFETSWGFSEGIALAKTQGYYDNNGRYQKGKNVFIDKTGRILFPSSSNSYIGFCDGLCSQKQNGKYGFIDKTGKFVISPIFDIVGDFYEGIAFANKGDKWGAIDKNGKAVIPFIYDDVRDCSEGLIPVNKNGKWGFVDKSNNVVIPIKYQIAGKFSDGLAMVIDEYGFGYIDKQGNSTFNPPASTNTAQNTNTEVIEVTETKSLRGSEVQSDNVIYGHKAVDLGLSVYWAECNIDASSIEDYGDYYSWGETYSKSTYSPNNYLYYENGSFENIGTNIAKTSYDAAHVRWGGPWRMPTKEEFEELIRECQWSWTTHNGVKGYKVQGANGNSIFLPSAGQTRNSSRHWTGERGYYWTSTVGKTSRYAYYLVFAPFVGNGVLGTETDNGYDFRYWGYVIRPVLDRKR